MYLGEPFAAAADCSLKPDKTLMASSPRIEELRKKFEENPRRYFAPLANEYRKAGDIEQAIAICREYLPQQPGHMSGHIVYGQALYEARQVEEAKSVFETALSLDPENLIALRHLGDIALMIGDSDGARMWYGRVLEADPRNEEIQAQLARLDQPGATAPTPVVTPQVEPAEPSPAAAATTAETAASSRPTPSSAPTVVVSAMRASPPPVEERVDKPLETVPPQSAPTDLATTLQPVPAVPHPEIEKSAHAPIGLEPTSMQTHETFGTQETVPLDISIVEQVARQRETPPIDSFSLEGLETTSMASQDAAPPPPQAPPAPVPEDVAPTVAQADTATVDIPLLDIGELPATPPAVVAATPPVEPAPEPVPPPAMEPMLEPLPPPAPEPVAELAFDNTAPESGPFVTETMAELYLHQGHHEEALRVYRALLEQRPGDQRLQEKIAALTATPAAIPATPPQAAPPAAAPVNRAGRSMRDLLAAIATRRPSGSATSPVHAANGGSPPEQPAPEPALPEPPQSPQQPAEPAPVEPARVEAVPAAILPERPRLADRLGSLFGSVDAVASDESAAVVLSQAFMELNGLEQGRAAEVTGAPARPANTELSLDAVFKGDETEKPAPSTFSFDQFFSQRATTEHPTPASGATSEARPRDDATQFTRWLEGLKQR